MPFARMFQFDRAGIPILQVKLTLANQLLRGGGADGLPDLQTKIDTARVSFKSFMSNLQDIKKAVAADTTVAGRSAAMPTIRQASRASPTSSST